MAAILDLAAILEKKVCHLLTYERAHPNAPLCKISCLYDKIHTLSWILHNYARLIEMCWILMLLDSALGEGPLRDP